MKHILYHNIVVDAGDELIPFIKIHPFYNSYLITEASETTKAKEYLDKRFGTYIILPKGRDALYAALSSYNLKKDDVVTVLTTSNNFYISKCVTGTIGRICKWNREICPQTKVIVFNHEFGYPCRDMKEVAQYGLPIIEDCAHTFYDLDPEIGKYSDFVVYSLPKAFPMQIGGVLKTNKRIGASTDRTVEDYVLKNLSIHVDKISEYKKKRQTNFAAYCENLASIGITPYFDDSDAIPGVYLFKWNDNIDYPSLKEYLYENGVECSVFYGKSAFFVPCHQYIGNVEIDYISELLHYYYINRV